MAFLFQGQINKVPVFRADRFLFYSSPLLRVEAGWGWGSGVGIERKGGLGGGGEKGGKGAGGASMVGCPCPALPRCLLLTLLKGGAFGRSEGGAGGGFFPIGEACELLATRYRRAGERHEYVKVLPTAALLY